MAEAVYILCALTSVLASGLLLRSYRLNRTTLLLWTAISFFALGLNNVLLVVDLILTGPTLDLSGLRTCVMLAGFMAMLYGLIWENPR